MVKDMVRLNTEAREQLLAFVNTGRAAAATLLHARILLTADVGVGDRHWTKAEMAEALDTSAATVHRVRQTNHWWRTPASRSQRPQGSPHASMMSMNGRAQRPCA